MSHYWTNQNFGNDGKKLTDIGRRGVKKSSLGLNTVYKMTTRQALKWLAKMTEVESEKYENHFLWIPFSHYRAKFHEILLQNFDYFWQEQNLALIWLTFFEIKSHWMDNNKNRTTLLSLKISFQKSLSKDEINR